MLGIGLVEAQLQPGGIRLGSAQRLDIGKRGRAVNFRLALTEQFQVRAVQNEQNGFCHDHS